MDLFTVNIREITIRIQFILENQQFGKSKFQNLYNQLTFVQEIMNQLKTRNYDKNYCCNRIIY
jgi:hypothetical protein